MTILRDGRSSWVNAAKPATVYGSTSTMKVQDLAGNTAYGFLQIGLGTGLREGATIHSAVLQIPTTGALTGSRTVSVQRANQSWKPRTLAWNNRPGVTGTATTITVGAVSAGFVMEFNVAADTQAWLDAGGVTHPGWRVSTNDATRRTLEGIPGAVLVIEYSYTPAAPTDLTPDGIVSVAKPMLGFTAGNIAGLQVQVDPAADEVSPDFDSGTVTTTSKQYDLAASAYSGLSSGQSTQWRARVVNTAGQWSEWSEWATFERLSKPALTIVSPTSDVYDSQHAFDADMADMTAVRWFVAKESAPATLLYDTGVIASTDGEHVPTVPIFKDDGTDYRVTVRAWDDVAREATPGDPTYVEASVTTTMNYSLVTTGPDTVTVSQVGSTPSVLVEFTEDTPGDAYTIARNDGWSERFDAADLLVSGDDYAYTDHGAPPNVPVTYTVHPHADDEMGEGESATITTTVTDTWLIDPETGDYVVIVPPPHDGTGSSLAAYLAPETAALHAPESSEHIVRRRLGRRKPEGSVSGFLVDSDNGDTALGFKATLEDWIDAPADKVFQLATGHVNLPVWVGDITLTPTPWTQNGLLLNIGASFSWWSARLPNA